MTSDYQIQICSSLVVRPDVCLEPGGLAEALVAVLAPDLPPDAVRAQVVPQAVPVRVPLVAHVANSLLGDRITELENTIQDQTSNKYD